MFIDLPDKLAVELNKIDWDRVKEHDLSMLIKFGVPFLKAKGYLKTSEGDKKSGKLSKSSNSQCEG